MPRQPEGERQGPAAWLIQISTLLDGLDPPTRQTWEAWLKQATGVVDAKEEGR